jgi:predicted DNA binding protein
MTVIAEFTIPSAEFILGDVLGQTEGFHMEIERVVPLDSRVMPYVWVSGSGFDEFERDVRSSEHVVSLTALDRIDDAVLYSIEWSPAVESLMNGFVVSNATILEAHGNAEWVFRVRFENHRDLSVFHDYCTDHDIAYVVGRIYTLDPESAAVNRFGLTSEQREILVAALEAGYYEVPRRTSLDDLAARYGITQQAASERLRRASDRVLSAMILDRSVVDA